MPATVYFSLEDFQHPVLHGPLFTLRMRDYYTLELLPPNLARAACTRQHRKAELRGGLVT